MLTMYTISTLANQLISTAKTCPYFNALVYRRTTGSADESFPHPFEPPFSFLPPSGNCGTLEILIPKERFCCWFAKFRCQAH